MRIDELEKELKKLNLEKVTDKLTQVFNRQALDNRMKAAIKQVDEGKLVCLIMLDIDDFKNLTILMDNALEIWSWKLWAC